MKILHLSLLVFFCSSLGCGSASSDGAPVSIASMESAATAVGTISRIDLAPKSAISARMPAPYQALEIFISDRMDFCSDFSSNDVHANQKTLLFSLARVGDSWEI